MSVQRGLSLGPSLSRDTPLISSEKAGNSVESCVPCRLSGTPFCRGSSLPHLPLELLQNAPPLSLASPSVDVLQPVPWSPAPVVPLPPILLQGSCLNLYYSFGGPLSGGGLSHEHGRSDTLTKSSTKLLPLGTSIINRLLGHWCYFCVLLCQTDFKFTAQGYL